MPTRTLSVTAEEIFPKNGLRKSWTIINEDTAQLLYVKRENNTTTVSATDHDYLIPTRSTLSLNATLDGQATIQSRWTIVADGATPRVGFFETEDVVR